jgi:aldehyde:ferredoxin oxidoreductase
MHDPRGKVGVGIGYALSPTGADHLEAPGDPVFESFSFMDAEFSRLGLLEPVDRMSLGLEKVRAFYYMQMVWGLCNCIGMCIFVAKPIGPLTLDWLKEYINAATGWNTSIFELVKVAERANTMARLFNTREGITSEDDTLPPRLFKPTQKGALKGVAIDRDKFQEAIQNYYQMAGWDEKGVPTLAKLAELDLLWTIEDEEEV